MRVVFLDIDGVLVTSRSILAGLEPPRFDPVACGLLTWVVEGADARIVVSSAWREGRTRDEMAEILRNAGLPVARLHEDWATPELGGPRGAEVLAWIAAHPEVRRWCVLDDGIGLESVAQRLVATDIDIGLTFAAALDACVMLGWDARASAAARGIKLSAAESSRLVGGS
jgi:hypothetical protein